MELEIRNWKAQIRKGYLELCILSIIRSKTSMYGSQILSELREQNIEVKEGTLYPLLKRMSDDQCLFAKWKTQNISGHSRKYYQLTENGFHILKSMEREFQKMTNILKTIKEDT